MRVTIAAIGRLKAGPERLLLDRFLDRANKAGRRFSLAVAVREIPESRAANAEARKDQEAAAILAALPAGAILVALDRSGGDLDSRGMAARLDRWREAGTGAVAFAIGGADGHGRALLARADLAVAFGRATWPHQLVRVMLAEQLYRAVAILAGHPYHRD